MIDYVLDANIRLGSPGTSGLFVDTGADGRLILLLLSARVDVRIRCAVGALVSRKPSVSGPPFGGSGVLGADGRLILRRMRTCRGDRQAPSERIVQVRGSLRKNVAAVLGSVRAVVFIGRCVMMSGELQHLFITDRRRVGEGLFFHGRKAECLSLCRNVEDRVGLSGRNLGTVGHLPGRGTDFLGRRARFG